MPLPEDEQRQLQEIERALYEDDPKFARRIRAGDPRVRSKRALLRVRPGQSRRARMMERMDRRWRRRQEGNGGRPGRTRS